MRLNWNQPPLVDQANVAITGGTGVPVILSKGGVPLIGLSSGSVAANGAISAITALPYTPPDAYCWFPANALATSIAAGWYYCTFSSTTAGVAFLNTYTSGTPTIPTSPTAVTDGKGAFTGDTGEEFGHTITIPPLGATSAIRVGVKYLMTNNANVKTGRFRLSGTGGTIFFSTSLASQSSAPFAGLINNTGAAAKQISEALGGFTVVPSDQVLGVIDTSVATTLVISIQRATATDNVIVMPPLIEMLL